MKTLHITSNPFSVDEWETVQVENVIESLQARFETWPATAKIYHNHVSQATDVTPYCKDTVERLLALDGDFYVIVYPAEPITILYAVVAVVVIAAVMMARQVPNPALRNTQSESPNNELSNRTNNSRPNARIPDIFGTVRSTPDLLAVPYRVYREHQEVEYCYMCVGRGSYEIPSDEIRDDTTRITEIAGSSVEVYAPFNSPNAGSPQLTIGSPITTPVYSMARSNAVNGQVLRPPKDQRLNSFQNVRFVMPNIIQRTSGQFAFSDKFEAGDIISISNAAIYANYVTTNRDLYANTSGFRFTVASSSTPTPSEFVAGAEVQLTNALWSGTLGTGEGATPFNFNLQGLYKILSVVRESEVVTPPTGSPYTVYYVRINLESPEKINADWTKAFYAAGTKNVTVRVSTGAPVYHFNGTYTVLSSTADTLTLSNPALVNPHWLNFPSPTAPMSPVIESSGYKWVGPFVMDSPSINRVISNYVALNGLYRDDGKNQYTFSATLRMEVTPVDAQGNAIGAAVNYDTVLDGSSITKSSRGVSLNTALNTTGRVKVRCARITPTDSAFEGNVVDEVKWRDLYAGNVVNKNNFGDVTTLQTVTYATTGALSVKDRKLNALVTRKLPRRITGDIFTETLYPTRNFADIFSAMCKDPYIGNRRSDELDFDNIYAVAAQIREYFGTDLAAEFCYTFDSFDLSFEESAQMVANACFSSAYRRGSVIKLSFEKSADLSTLLFNHRNKIPGSESKTVNFGNQNDYDGIAFKYIDPQDDAQITLYIPEDRSSVNAQTIESVGVRNGFQAYALARRAWNKQRYQNTFVEFEATQEADILVLQDKVLVADNTRANIYDGEIRSQDGLLLVLSQPAVVTGSSVIFLQLPDGTVESIPILDAGSDKMVLLTRAPRIPLALSSSNYARTTYIITDETVQGPASAYLVTEKSPQSGFTVKLTASIYDDKFYQNDRDYINGHVDINGIQL